MSQSDSSLATLKVRAADDGTEIFVMDASFERLAQGRGVLEVDVRPGLYKVRFRSGASLHDELVEVPRAGKTKRVEGPPIEFHAAIPLQDTKTTHEYHQAPAHDLSRQLHERLGRGGRLFLFVREEDEARKFTVPHVTLHRLDGTRLAKLSDGEADKRKRHGRWAALSLQLDPGTYALRVRSGHVGEYEIFVTVSPNWQTQVFLVMEDFWREGRVARAPSLRTASLHVVKERRGFRPDDRRARVAELARQALTQGRDVVSESVMQQLLSGKFEAPMLGLFAANLLLRRHKTNWSLLNTVCTNLTNLLGRHPDLDALKWALRDWKDDRPETLATPPSLRASWEHVVRASRRRARLVPPDSPLAEIAHELVHSGPWLMHRIEKDASKDAASSSANDRKGELSVANARRALERLVEVDRKTLETWERNSRTNKEVLSTLEHRVLEAAISVTDLRELEGESASSSSDSGRRLLRQFSAPTYALADAVLSLAKKMDV